MTKKAKLLMKDLKLYIDSDCQICVKVKKGLESTYGLLQDSVFGFNYEDYEPNVNCCGVAEVGGWELNNSEVCWETESWEGDDGYIDIKIPPSKYDEMLIALKQHYHNYGAMHMTFAFHAKTRKSIDGGEGLLAACRRDKARITKFIGATGNTIYDVLVVLKPFPVVKKAKKTKKA